MNLPVNPPILPMLAKRIDKLRDGQGWLFEPKWDGFRTLVFRDGNEILLQSREGKSLNRYFPELLEPMLAQLPSRCVLDGEIVVAKDYRLDFEELQLRIHPAASRVKMLSQQSPASIVFFDLICEGSQDWRSKPFNCRRSSLESVLARAVPPIHLTPATHELKVALDWFKRFEGAGLDGVIAKTKSDSYQSDKRVMFKIKHERDCDCVVGGFRWHKDAAGNAIGSLLLGLFDDSGALQHVGVCASFTQERRRELVDFLAPYRRNALDDHPWRFWAESTESERMPGAQSRWSRGKDLSWEPLRPELVVEVAYEHLQGRRFRHMSQFRRWRTDKHPRDCTYAQLEVVPPHELKDIFGVKR
jgi:ATP-dependent DNA ligase